MAKQHQRIDPKKCRHTNQRGPVYRGSGKNRVKVNFCNDCDKELVTPAPEKGK